MQRRLYKQELVTIVASKSLFQWILIIVCLVNLFSGTSDPYCEVSMGSQEHRTKVIPKDINPKWNSTVSEHFLSYYNSPFANVF